MNIQEYAVDISADLATNILLFNEQVPDGNHCSNKGGWQYYYQDNIPSWLTSTVDQVSALFPNYSIVDAWMNINGPGHSNRWHRHHGDDISAVLYVQTPTNSGKIEFRVDRKNYSIDPAVGKMIVFPGDYMHCVHENKSQENRISLAFNLIKR